MRRPSSHPNLATVEKLCSRFVEGHTTAPTFYKRGTVVVTEIGHVWAVSAVPDIVGKGVPVVVGQYGTDHFFVVDVKS